MTDPRRALVIAEARSWLKTPYHHEQRLKGAGADCGTLPLAVYEAAGVIPHVDVPHYPMDFAMHSDDEWYRRIVESFAKPVEVPRPGDFAIWQWGRSFSHGAIVVDRPWIIHAWARAQMVIEHRADKIADLQFMRDGKPRPVLFFSPFAD